MLDLINKFYINTIMRDDPRFRVSKEDQQKILDSIKTPQNDIERSYAQYLCQKKLNRRSFFWFNLVSPIIILIYYVRIPKMAMPDLEKTSCDLLCMLSGIGKERVPEKLLKKYKNVRFSFENDNLLLNSNDVSWFRNNIVKQYPFDFLFHLKALKRIAQYRFLIEKYHPKAIANHVEYSCCTSLLTEFCHSNGISHIDFMHGEKVYYINDSFFHFDECYVWNEHYQELFLKLKAKCDNFIIDVPPEFMEPGKKVDELDEADYTYYLASESKEQMEKIVCELLKIQNNGFKVRIRPHPRWTEKKALTQIARGIDIESNNIGINDSIYATRNVISLFSTVLFQAYLKGRTIVIDDVTNTKKYRLISEADFIGISLPHRLLSGVVKEGEHKWQTNKSN